MSKKKSRKSARLSRWYPASSWPVRKAKRDQVAQEAIRVPDSICNLAEAHHMALADEVVKSLKPRHLSHVLGDARYAVRELTAIINRLEALGVTEDATADLPASTTPDGVDSPDGASV
ncbi:hypothetical protein AYO38_02095 [bacterium SCGC AG-212-C10]|nr:hypothetical protein AYO38_02095 [bacterium SCGC AG-212-C10]